MTPEKVGRGLREIRGEHLRQEKGENVRWFQNPGKADLIAWWDEAGYTLVQLFFEHRPNAAGASYRYLVQWARDSGISTGEVEARRIYSSSTYSLHRARDEVALQATKRLLAVADEVPAELKDLLLV